MPDPWTAAWEEAEATLPPAVTLYNTIELQHPTFVVGSTPYGVRIVSDVADNVSFTIEVGATLNGGETVVFTAVPFYAEFPEIGEGKVPQSTITIDNIAREVMPLLEAASIYKADLKAIFRQYRSDDLTEPCYGPVEFIIKKVSVTGTAIQGIAMLDNLSNRKFPTRNYNITEFPGLQ